MIGGGGLRIHAARLVHNAAASRTRAYGPAERRVVSRAAFEAARAEIAAWPGYAPTPLVPLRALAGRLDLGAILYKDESGRFGLGSFKALGGAYAVLGVLREYLARNGRPAVPTGALLAGAERDRTRPFTVATATDGNHGRSVAWGAQLLGCGCVVYLHEHVSRARETAIARFGAAIRRVPGHYDAAVRRCAEDARINGWALVPDTSDDPDALVPARVMQGYTLIAQEILDALPPEQLPTHVFVQAGVGGLAAALAAHFWETLGPDRPRIVVVEPERADCVLRTVAAGIPTPVPGDPETFMACLAAGEISAPAWVILRHAADDVIAIPDDAARDAMRVLAGGEPPIVAGESGCAAIAGLLATAQVLAQREALGLGAGARVLAIGSEGATDEPAYRDIVGRAPAHVAPC